MFRFFKDLCGKSDEDKLDEAIKKSQLTFQQAIGSAQFSSGSNSLLSLGYILLEHLDEMKDDSLTTEVQEKIELHDLIIAGTISIVLIANYFKYDDPLVPFELKDLEEGLENDFDSVIQYAGYAHDNKSVRDALLDYVTGIGKKILIDKKFPLLEFDSPSGGHRPFHCSVDSLLINSHPGVKRHSCLKLYDYPGQYAADYYRGGKTREERSQMREQKRIAIEQAEQAKLEEQPALTGFRFC